MSIRAWWNSLTEEETAYLLASMALILCVLVNLVGARLGFHLSGWAFLLPVALFAYGFAQFIEGVWKTARKSALVKVANSVVVILGGGVVVAASGVAVNWSLQVPSSAFPHTRAMVAVLCLPGVALIALPFAAFFASPLVMLISMAERFPRSFKEVFSRTWWKNPKGTEIVVGVRMIVVIIILGASLAALKLTGPYSEWLADVARWYAYHFEAEKFSHCRLANDQRIAYIGGDYVVRVKPLGSDFVFEMGLCSSPLNSDGSLR
jgi:hypothetical protein